MMTLLDVDLDRRVLFDTLPPALTSVPQWVAWKREDLGGSKPAKVPYTTSGRAKSDDSTTWLRYADACALYERGGYDGLGFVFSPHDPFVGIDLDHCRDPETGELAPWATAIIARLDSYAEVSPSGTGVHVVVKGKLPEHGRKKGNIEMYDAGRFFTMTGQHLADTPRTVEERTTAVHALHTEVFGEENNAPAHAPGPGAENGTSALSDEDLLARARGATNGAKFSDLFAGDWNGYASQSEADLALCSMLAFYCGPDPTHIDRLFQQSELYRPKWEEKHFSGGTTYGEATIAKALAGTREFYTVPGTVKGDATPSLTPETGNGSPPARTGFSFTRLGDLLKEPEETVAWLVDGLLPAGGFSVFVAKPKVGKSTLARNLALAIARGEPFFNRATQQGAVIYLALEEKRSEVKKHFQAMGATGEENIDIHAASAPADALRQIRAVVEEKKPVLLIIDPLFRFTRVKDGNDYAQVTAAMEPLMTLARQTGAHVVCVHHAGKGGDRDGGDAILGSTAIFAAVDTAIILKRSERYRTISTIQRYGEDLPETVLRFDPTTRTLALGESKEAEEGKRIEAAMLAVLQLQEEDKEKGHALTQAELDEAVEGKTAYKRKAVKALLTSNKLARLGKGGKSDPFRYCLKDSCFVVPAYSREQGNKNQEDGATLQEDFTFSCSRDSELLPLAHKTREQASCPFCHRAGCTLTPGGWCCRLSTEDRDRWAAKHVSQETPLAWEEEL